VTTDEQRLMKIVSRHERLIAAPPERLAELVRDFDRIWPTEIAPAPQAAGERLFDAGPMLWQEVDRPGASRAFVVAGPGGLRAEHWFEVEPVDGGALLCHTIEGEALGTFESIWAERVEPLHDRVLEALLDNVAAAATAEAQRSPSN
jgi:hypothetical protein